MYRYHQDAVLVESYLEGVTEIGLTEGEMVPDVQESVSVDKDGVLTITLNNLSPDEEREMEVVLQEGKTKQVEASLLHGNMRSYNTFHEPELVKEEIFTDYVMTDRGIRFSIPACSVLLLRICQ